MIMITVAKILCLLYALWTIIDIVLDLAESKKASDITFFLCRPLRIISTHMIPGTILWIIAIVAAVYAFNYGITLF